MAKLKTVIYLSSKYISLVQGTYNAKTKRVSVDKKVLTEMPDGAVVNGVINDEDMLAAAFKEATESLGKINGAELVLDTTHIISRLSVLPKVSQRETDTLIKNEFVNRSMADKEYIYDYSVVKSANVNSKQQYILSCAIDKTIIDTYKAFFTRIGLKLDRIDFAANTVIQAASALANPWGGVNALVCVVDNYIVSIINFLSNGEIFFHRSRILSSVGGEQYFQEISDVLRSYIQGRKSLDRNEETGSIYIFDGNCYEPEKYAEYMAPLECTACNVGVKTLLSVDRLIDEDADKFLYCLTALYPGFAKNLDLREMRKYIVLSKGQRQTIAGIAVFSVLAAAVVVYMLLTYGSIVEMRAETDENTQFILSSEAINAAAEHTALTTELEALNATLAELSSSEITVNASVILKSEVLFEAIEIFNEADFRNVRYFVDGVEFSAEDRTVTISISFTDVSKINLYVSKLRETGLFDDVGYTGYNEGGSLPEAGLSETEVYTYQVVGLIKEMKAVE
jgi:hypothetical protein